MRPLIGLSTNNGVTWTFPESITLVHFTPNNTHPFSMTGNFSSISCSGTTCVAGGQYTDTLSIVRPLIAVSNDSGATWTYPDSVTSPVFLPGNINPFQNQGLIQSVKCMRRICVGAGQYTDINQIKRPMTIVSYDLGATWVYQDQTTSPVFSPSNSYPFAGNGSFKTSGVNVAPWRPKSLEYLFSN